MTDDAVAAIHRLATAALRQRGLAPFTPALTLGRITLLPHQIAALHWIRPRLVRYGGALLADPPGLGKTYVALAVAAERRETPLVIAPAAVRVRWRAASRETGVPLVFLSTERLSAPAPIQVSPATLVIIDEAHHLRSRSTRRHQRTADLCARATVLLLSATPIHNRAGDLEQIARLLHLPPTRQSAMQVRRRLTLRRTLTGIHAASPEILEAHAVPRIRNRATPRLQTEHATLPSTIISLPSIGAAADEGHALLQLGLLHALRSSDTAARERIQRRIAACLAIEQSVEAGIEPTPVVRRAWQARDGDVQLALPALLGTPLAAPDPRLSDGAARQRRALEALLPHLTGSGDAARSVILRRMARWCERPVVAFTQFSATAARLFHLLRHEAGIALLTGAGAQIATGAISREEVLERLLSPRHATQHDAVRLLLTTDVLSEGLSLAGVATVIHLDLPWTAARLDQRVGRAARIGAPVREVRVLQLPAPLPHAATAALDALLARKRHAMLRVVRDVADDGCVGVLQSLCACTDAPPRRSVWVTVLSRAVEARTIIAIVRVRDDRLLVAMDPDGLRAPEMRDWQALAAARVAPPHRGGVSELRRALSAWLANSDLATMVRDRRDERLQRRWQCDELLTRSDRSSREQIAAAVAARFSVHQSHAAEGFVPERSTAEIRILCGVQILPAPG